LGYGRHEILLADNERGGGRMRVENIPGKSSWILGRETCCSELEGIWGRKTERGAGRFIGRERGGGNPIKGRRR